ncbi:MAG: hypothetical protein JRN66_08625 [Nitrososphaerota archaeon]|nr:hypothetical protein [Nitrososphaerota archaeon]
MRVETRGIGEIIGMLILIAVTITIAGVVFMVFEGYFNRAQNLPSVALSSSLVCSNNISTCLLNFNVKNTGNVPITALSVTEGSTVLYSGTGLSIGPGGSTSGNGPTTMSCTAGNTYTVSATVEYASGSNGIQTVSVACQP